MDQTINIVLEANESSETRELRHLARDEITDFVIFVDVRPWIFGELFETERNALVGFVDFEHHGLDIIALLQHFGRMIDLARPGYVRDVDHAIQTIFQFDKRAVTGEVANLPTDLAARRILLRGFVPWIGFELAHAERNLLFVPVDA